MDPDSHSQLDGTGACLNHTDIVGSDVPVATEVYAPSPLSVSATSQLPRETRRAQIAGNPEEFVQEYWDDIDGVYTIPAEKRIDRTADWVLSLGTKDFKKIERYPEIMEYVFIPNTQSVPFTVVPYGRSELYRLEQHLKDVVDVVFAPKMEQQHYVSDKDFMKFFNSSIRSHVCKIYGSKIMKKCRVITTHHHWQEFIVRLHFQGKTECVRIIR